MPPSGAFSAQIYRQPDVDPKLVYETLCKIRDQYPGSISQIFTKEQAADLHLTGEFDFCSRSRGSDSL